LETHTLKTEGPQFATKRPPRLRRWEASTYLLEQHGLQVATATLAKYASVGGGPAYQLVGRAVLYPVDELDRWALSRMGPLVRSTSEYRKLAPSNPLAQPA
jgi:hypothetical protein